MANTTDIPAQLSEIEQKAVKAHVKANLLRQLAEEAELAKHSKKPGYAGPVQLEMTHADQEKYLKTGYEDIARDPVRVAQITDAYRNVRPAFLDKALSGELSDQQKSR